MGAGRFLLNILVVLAAVLAGVYQLKLKPMLTKLGYWREADPVGTRDCITVPELPACEKLVLHQPSGVIYLACSTPESRVQWLPNQLRLNSTGASHEDYVATYDPATQKVTKLSPTKFTSPRGLSLHGMDVVPSSTDPSELWIYLVNHRAPLVGDAKEVGADSAIEVFKTTAGSSTMEYVRTVESPLIITPNDVTGTPDGKAFWVTNDHSTKTGASRKLELFRSVTSVVYCSESEGCKYAIRNMNGNNGITHAANGTFYVVNCFNGVINVLEQQADNTLIVTDVIDGGRSMDNAHLDAEGHLWVAGFVNAFTLTEKHFADPKIPSPSTILRFSLNTGPSSFYGEKFKVDRVFEDDGSLASGITSAAYDTERNKLFMNGISSPHLVVCNA